MTDAKTISAKKYPKIPIIGILGYFRLAAGLGFEPRQTESESVVLPLHNPAIFITNMTDARIIILYYSIMSSDSL